MYEILLTESYRKKVIKFLKKYPQFKEKYKKSFHLLQLDPFHDALNSKKTKGFASLYRIRLSYRARIIIEVLIKKKRIIPISIDTRESIY